MSSTTASYTARKQNCLTTATAKPPNESPLGIDLLAPPSNEYQPALPTELLEKIIALLWLSPLPNSTRIAFLTAAPLVSRNFAAVAHRVSTRDVVIPSAAYAHKFMNNVMNEPDSMTSAWSGGRQRSPFSGLYQLSSRLHRAASGQTSCFCEPAGMYTQLRSLTFQIESPRRVAPSRVSAGVSSTRADLLAYVNDEGSVTEQHGISFGIEQTPDFAVITDVPDATLEPEVAAAMFDVLYYLHGVPERLPRLRTISIIYAGCPPALALADLFEGLRLINFPPQVSDLRVRYIFSPKHVRSTPRVLMHNLHLAFGHPASPPGLPGPQAPWPHVPPHQLIAGQTPNHPPQLPPLPPAHPLGLWVLPGVTRLEVCGAGVSSVAAELAATCPHLKTLVVDAGAYLPALAPLPESMRTVVLRRLERGPLEFIGQGGKKEGEARVLRYDDTGSLFYGESFSMRQALEDSKISRAIDDGLFRDIETPERSHCRHIVAEIEAGEEDAEDFVRQMAKTFEEENICISHRITTV
ncbi:hypothetical protein HGRIS_004877 [Hohenbuehelia grisea]|uniref:F-box domain-containing protein n=1 Tax=Hohenbuehelia grisea TaxID=104357 RepID=A0ABR3JDG8_9AGAR